MSSSQAKWDCSQCGCAPNDRRKYCTECHSMLTWTCTSSGKSEQRPWSEWRRTNASCLQHTDHDVEQVQELYSMCEQLLMNYCSHKNHQLTNSATTSYLSPMNTLVVTLWYLKRHHSERYIALELNLSQQAANYLLSTVVNILHSCLHPDLISIPANISSSRTPYEPQ
ncbi:unnamed protein product [Rotaria sp. Silwood2]|nr:unnamed protein product [Rotaria sp. Silwood2]